MKDDFGNGTFKPFLERGENWENVERVKQFSDNIEVLRIKYTPEETELMDYFRGIIKSKEISMRVFNLTSEVIDSFPSNYMAWVVRRQCIDKLKEIDLNKELNWLDGMIINNQKNYQIWHHRKLLVDKMNDCSHEKKVLGEVLDIEQKNFHAWTYRIWVVRRFDLVDGEFDFIEKMLKEDVKNNSVWNYRYFLVNYINWNKITEEIIKSEIKYALDKINLKPNNESPYSYIRGFITKNNKKISDYPFLEKEMMNIINKDEENTFARGILLDFYEETKKKEKFMKLIEELQKIDYIRKKYYGWRKENYVD